MGNPVTTETTEGARSTGRQSVTNQSRQQPSGPQSVFEYGNLRPDAPNASPIGFTDSVPTRAWLRGSRLYSFNQGGANRAAVRLEEPGYAVMGYVMKPPQGSGIASVLEESERKEYSPQLYERDVVEVVTETGEQHSCYVYHRQDVNRESPVPTGDWLNRGRTQS